MSYTMICVLMCFLVACFIACRFMNAGASAILAKTMASLGLVVGAVLAVSQGYKLFYVYIIIALVCGLLGDMYTELKYLYPIHKSLYLNFYMVGFGLGQIMYVIALTKMIPYGFSITGDCLISLGAGALFAIIWIFLLSRPIKLDFGKLKWQSAVYYALLVFVVVLSFLFKFKYNLTIILPISFILFLLSNIALSFQYFGQEKFENSMTLTIITHILYYTAQLLIVKTLYM